MKLTLEQIKQITFGALNVQVTENGFEFNRCTPKQVAAWYEADRELGLRAEKTTGVRLDFHTNAKPLPLQPTMGDTYEVQLDGLPRHRFHAGDYIEIDQPVVLPLGEGEKRVTVILPSHTRGALR